MRDNHAMVHIRVAVAADRHRIRAMVVGAGLLPTGLDWRRFLVAEEGGRVVGCVQMRRHRDANELSSLVVAREQRGRGIARMLIDELLRREAGVVHLMCHERLIEFYRRFGFAVIDADLPGALRRKRAAGRFFGMPVVCMVRR
jgi:N-acetylglutamate synthase-like GNAT family acetyltransferase